MNERIIEIAKQCGYWSGQTIEMNDVGIAKFAELIVQECAYAIDQHNTKSYQVSQPFSIEQILTKHFGVEQ